MDITERYQQLKYYYRSIMPGRLIQKWLSYENEACNQFGEREVAVMLTRGVIRWKFFPNMDSLVQFLCFQPHTAVSVGAQFTGGTKTGELVKREFIIDIDLTDFDPVRNCCQKESMCERCWPMIVVAVKIVDHVLQKFFGFQKRLWVFSGRRGVHCWVCDQWIRTAQASLRRNVIDFFKLVPMNSSQTPLYANAAFIDSRKSVFNILEEHFEPVCLVGQNVFMEQKTIQVVKENTADTAFHSTYTEMEQFTTSKERWDFIVQSFEEYCTGREDLPLLMHNLPLQIMSLLLFPRLDTQVSVVMNHLLRLPFTVHQTTNRLVVPFNADCVEAFRPAMVPTLEDIINEVDALYLKSKPSSTSKWCKPTIEVNTLSIGPAIKFFDEKIQEFYKLEERKLPHESLY